MATPHSTPATAFRSGSVNAAVWDNTGETGPFFSITFSRPYEDTQGHWKTSSSYGLNDPMRCPRSLNWRRTGSVAIHGPNLQPETSGAHAGDFLTLKE